jgi:SsrA-binding protein
MVTIENRKARFEYEILDRYVAGMALTGTEIKSIRQGKASISESFCEFTVAGELFVINMNVEEYSHGTHYNHAPKRPRKLLLSKKELRKLRREVADAGLTIIPLRLFINQEGLAKLEVALARGKKLYDKRETIKKRDTERHLDTVRKRFR